MCLPPALDLHTLAYHVRSVARIDGVLPGLGVVDLVAVGLLVGCVHAAARPGELRRLRTGALILTVVATLPFVIGVAVVSFAALLRLTRDGWALNLLNGPLLGRLVCCVVVLAFAAGAAATPATAVVLSTYRLRLATDQQDLSLRQLQKWAACGGAPVAVQWALATWQVAAGHAGHALLRVWTLPHYELWLAQTIVAAIILLLLATATVAAVLLPLRTATQSIHLRKTPARTLPEPSRFAACTCPRHHQITP